MRKGLAISKKLWKTRRNGRKAHFGVAACLIAALGVMASQEWGPPWLLFPLIFITAMGPIALLFLQDQLAAHEAGKANIERSMLTIGANLGRPPTVAKAMLSDFGVHTSLQSVPYIKRRAETEVRQALRSGKPVLILGPSMVGKSRMAAEILLSEFSERVLVIPAVPDGLAMLLSNGHLPKDSVIWLNDLERYLSDPRHLKAKWIKDLTNNGNLVVATMREKVYESFLPTGDKPRDQWELLGNFHNVRLMADDEERQELADCIAVPTISAGVLRYGLGVYLGGGYIALERYHSGKTGHPLGVALIQAAVGWQLIGASEAIPRDVAARVAVQYLTVQQVEDNLENFEAALMWATEWCSGTGSFRLLSPIGENLRPFDYVTDHLVDAGLWIPDALWEAVIEADEFADMWLVAGLAALDYGNPTTAFLLFQRAAEWGDARGMANLGTMLRRQGRTGEAEEWFSRSAALGDEYGMNGLGLIYAARGEKQEAEKLYRQAGSLGYGTAISNLGLLLNDRGQTHEAEVLFRQAAEMNNGWALANLGQILSSRGQEVEAKALFLRATALGNPAGMYELAALLDAQGQYEEAEELYRDSADLGSPAGQTKLGIRLAEQGQGEEAERFLRRAASQDDMYGAYNLGIFLRNQQRFDEAEGAFRQAAEQGHPTSMSNLGILLERRGLVKEAEVQYRGGAKQEDLEAIHNLAVFLLTQGQNGEAEDWLRKAVKSGFAPSMVNLGTCERERGNLDNAAQLYQHAADLGMAGGLTGMGAIYYERGDLTHAEVVLREASAAGDAVAMYNLATLLEEQGELEEAQTLYRKSAELGFDPPQLI